MQAQNPEVSGDKANTPAADLRLVSVEQLRKIHRELDACQKVIWLAGCRPRVPNGFDPAYVTGAQEQLQVIEGLMKVQPGATEALQPCGGCSEGLQLIDPYDGGTYVTCKRCNGRGFVVVCPTCRQGVPADSAHLLSGATEVPQWTHEKPTQPGAYWIRGNGLMQAALIKVQIEAGALWCNLHMSTTEPDFGHGYTIEQLSEEFEWFGPLGALPAEVNADQQVGKSDPLYRAATESVIQNQRASISFLQRRLGIGYNRAARMIEAMERDRIVSGMNSDGARAVLMLEVPHA